jgi:hypothetical protein
MFEAKGVADEATDAAKAHYDKVIHQLKLLHQPSSDLHTSRETGY